jgi:hypothetical protein
MKKIILALAFIISLMSVQSAGAQQLRFYYYPSSNVYYDIAGHQYIYLDNGTWLTVTSLPPGVAVTGRKVLIRHSGKNVWVNNKVHKAKYYTAPPKGKAVGYKGTNPNKKKGKNK